MSCKSFAFRLALVSRSGVEGQLAGAVRQLPSSAATRRAADDLDGALGAAARAVAIDPHDDALHDRHGTTAILGREAAVHGTYELLDDGLPNSG